MNPPSPPWLEYEEIRYSADSFLEEYWPNGSIPVNVEKIVDARIGIDIITVSGLQSQIGVDGFLSRDCDTIYVDERIASAVPTRYRFTLAHELGHYELHEELYQFAQFTSPEEWLQFQRSIAPKDYSRYEYQAYCFAGLILVPKAPLANAVDEAVAKAKQSGYDVDLEDAADRAYVADWVGRMFAVSAEVVARRGKFDGLWSEH